MFIYSKNIVYQNILHILEEYSSIFIDNYSSPAIKFYFKIRSLKSWYLCFMRKIKNQVRFCFTPVFLKVCNFTIITKNNCITKGVNLNFKLKFLQGLENSKRFVSVHWKIHYNFIQFFCFFQMLCTSQWFVLSSLKL